MGRKIQKNVGVLVRMGRRRIQGLGLIIARTDKPPAQMSHKEWKEKLGESYVTKSEEICALVHWIKKPSEWEMERTYSNRTWVPLSWLRIVKKEGE